MSKLQDKIDGELWQVGKIIIHGDTEPEAVINTKGKTTVDIDAMKQSIDKYLTEYAEKLGGSCDWRLPTNFPQRKPK